MGAKTLDHHGGELETKTRHAVPLPLRNRSVTYWHMAANRSAGAALDRTFAALADPTRRKLIERIGRKPHRAGDLCRGLTMSRPAVSKHLRVLRHAGLVSTNARGREIVYRLSPAAPGLAEARAYMARMSHLWDRALEAFKAFAEREEVE
jgi:DNA-binding transcriptional ArsR family regulator